MAAATFSSECTTSIVHRAGACLVEVRHGRRLLPVRHIDELVVEGHASIARAVLWLASHVGQVPKLLIPPIVQGCQGRTSATLNMHAVSVMHLAPQQILHSIRRKLSVRCRAHIHSADMHLKACVAVDPSLSGIKVMSILAQSLARWGTCTADSSGHNN